MEVDRSQGPDEGQDVCQTEPETDQQQTSGKEKEKEFTPNSDNTDVDEMPAQVTTEEEATAGAVVSEAVVQANAEGQPDQEQGILHV